MPIKFFACKGTEQGFKILVINTSMLLYLFYCLTFNFELKQNLNNVLKFNLFLLKFRSDQNTSNSDFTHKIQLTDNEAVKYKDEIIE